MTILSLRLRKNHLNAFFEHGGKILSPRKKLNYFLKQAKKKGKSLSFWSKELYQKKMHINQINIVFSHNTKQPVFFLVSIFFKKNGWWYLKPMSHVTTNSQRNNF